MIYQINPSPRPVDKTPRRTIQLKDQVLVAQKVAQQVAKKMTLISLVILARELQLVREIELLLAISFELKLRQLLA
jgi:hypothetical protein